MDKGFNSQNMSVKRNADKIRKQFKVPDKKLHRIVLGWVLVIGGLVGFLPVVGFWMLPLGIIILSVDFPFARRLRRRVEVWWGRRKLNKSKPPS